MKDFVKSVFVKELTDGSAIITTKMRLGKEEKKRIKNYGKSDEKEVDLVTGKGVVDDKGIDKT